MGMRYVCTHKARQISFMYRKGRTRYRIYQMLHSQGHINNLLNPPHVCTRHCRRQLMKVGDLVFGASLSIYNGWCSLRLQWCKFRKRKTKSLLAAIHCSNSAWLCVKAAHSISMCTSYALGTSCCFACTNFPCCHAVSTHVHLPTNVGMMHKCTNKGCMQMLSTFPPLVNILLMSLNFYFNAKGWQSMCASIFCEHTAKQNFIHVSNKCSGHLYWWLNT